MFEIDDLLLERAAIDKEIRERVDEELADIEKRRAQLLAITGQQAPADSPIPPPVKLRHVGQPKYRHPDGSGETWTGRGAKPKWFQDWIRNGHDPNELRIAA